MGGLFGGGGSYDGGAAQAALMQAQTARENMQAEAERWDREQQQMAQSKLDDQSAQARQASNLKADTDLAKKQQDAADAAAKLTAQDSTSGYQWNNTRTDNTKALASTGLPFDQLQQQTQAQYSALNQGYNGQGNSVISNPAISFGGRKYI